MTDLKAPETIQKLETKLSAARTRLILDKPFIGALALRLPLKVADPSWCPTTGTDARAFYYNPAYIHSLRTEEIQFVMAHEALHCALSHFARRQHRVKQRWDLACDFAINPILIAEGLKPPPGLVTMPQYEGMSAEEIYPLLDDNEQAETMDQHLYDKQDNPAEGGQDQLDNPLDSQSSGQREQSPASDAEQPEQQRDGNDSAGESHETESAESPGNTQHDPKQPPESGAGSGEQAGDDTPPPPLSHDEIEMLSQQWQQRMAGAAQQAEMAGRLSGTLQRLIDAQRQADLPWRMVLARHLSSTARDDYDFRRPSSRRGDPALMPTLRSTQINLVVALDVSGSIRDEELSQYFAEINALKGQLRARVTVLACDAEIIDGFPLVFDVWENLELEHEVAGGGNTDFRPVFDYVAGLDTAPDAVLYFTDALGVFPDRAPDCAVIWLVKGRGEVPWGERVQYC